MNQKKLETTLKSKKTFFLLIGFNVVLLLTLSFMTTLTATKAASSIAEKLKGRILLQVEQNGEAWYVNPVDNKRYFLGRPADAFEIMRNLGLGITDQDLNQIPTNTNIETSNEVGYIKDAYLKNGKRYIDIDYIQFLTGEEGLKAAIEDGRDCPDINYCLPNGFYVRNQNPQLRTFEIKEGISVKLVTQFVYSDDGIRYIGFEDQFIGYIKSNQNNNPFDIKIENQVVTEISERYIP